MYKIAITCILFIFLSFSLYFGFILYQQQTKTVNTQLLWSLVQKWRIDNQLPAYTLDTLTCTTAIIRSKQIQTDWSHQGFLANPERWCGGNACHIAENLASNIKDEQTILNLWLQSPRHLANLKADYPYACIACDQNYCAQIFARYP